MCKNRVTALQEVTKNLSQTCGNAVKLRQNTSLVKPTYAEQNIRYRLVCGAIVNDLAEVGLTSEVFNAA